MNKRFLALLCAIVMLLMIPLAALATTTRYIYTKNGKSLNHRSAPIAHANNKIGNIPYGASVAVDSYVNDKTWAYVKYNGKWGYVMSRYLVNEKPAARKQTSTSSSSSSKNPDFGGFEAASYTVSVRPSAPGGFVNLRWAPSKSESIMSRLYDGATLEVISQNKTWAQVRVPETGAVGFVMRAFLSQSTGGAS